MTYKVVDGKLEETLTVKRIYDPDDLKREREMLLEEIDRAQNEIDRANAEIKAIDERLSRIEAATK